MTMLFLETIMAEHTQRTAVSVEQRLAIGDTCESMAVYRRKLSNVIVGEIESGMLSRRRTDAKRSMVT